MLDVDELLRFQPIDGVELPAGDYDLVDVDTGADTLNVAPNDALERILGAGRSPLTLEEGISLVIAHPEAVVPGHGFSLLGSRAGDKRVTAIWVAKEGLKLGWCWAGNPHTWLGSASCAERVAV